MPVTGCHRASRQLKAGATGLDANRAGWRGLRARSGRVLRDRGSGVGAYLGDAPKRPLPSRYQARRSRPTRERAVARTRPAPRRLTFVPTIGIVARDENHREQRVRATDGRRLAYASTGGAPGATPAGESASHRTRALGADVPVLHRDEGQASSNRRPLGNMPTSSVMTLRGWNPSPPSFRLAPRCKVQRSQHLLIEHKQMLYTLAFGSESGHAGRADPPRGQAPDAPSAGCAASGQGRRDRPASRPDGSCAH